MGNGSFMVWGMFLSVSVYWVTFCSIYYCDYIVSTFCLRDFLWIYLLPVLLSVCLSGYCFCYPGYYCDSLNQTEETGLCQAGFYCLEGSIIATSLVCPAGKYCPTGMLMVTDTKVKLGLLCHCHIATGWLPCCTLKKTVLLCGLKVSKFLKADAKNWWVSVTYFQMFRSRVTYQKFKVKRPSYQHTFSLLK